MQQSVGGGKSIIRGLQSVIVVADNQVDPDDNYTSSYSLNGDIAGEKGNCGWKVAAARVVRAALVV